MKSFKLFSFLLCMAFPAVAQNVQEEDFARGADISWVTEYERNGYKFYNADGEETDCFVLMKQLGLNAIRLRVWVDPKKHGNWCDKNDLLAKAKRTQALGMDIMVDFHYSDFWADPAKQNIPEAWKSHSYQELKKDVADHTVEVLQLLKDNGITPKWVQVGNEISNGFLWETGRAQTNPKQYAGLFAAGYDAVKQVFPESIVIVHLDNGFDEDLYNWNLDALKNNGARFDMIGMSLYPYWSMDAGKEPTAEKTIADCITNIKKVSKKYGCDVMIVETGMECADDQGNLANEKVLNEGRAQLTRIIRESLENTDGHCKGVFYWEPECKPGRYRLGAFTDDGRPTVIMDAFRTTASPRSEVLLEKNWKFMQGDDSDAFRTDYNDSRWQSVTVPHDWAIFGPFDRSNDLQEVAVTQNFEQEASVKTGRTGGLPYVGIGWYRTTFDALADKQVTLVFDGAMSEARVYVNGQEACFWPFGYNSFHCDVTSLLNKDGKANTLAIRLENKPQSSRWYPGAGLYRNVHLVTTEAVHVPVWGTQITTPHVAEDYASVCLKTTIEGVGEKDVRILTDIVSPDGIVVATKDNTLKINHGKPFEQNFLIETPALWSPETPSLYHAVSRIYVDGEQVDEYTTRFGIRSIEIVADNGFYLNGKRRKFQGVCNHHDLGPLGAAVNVAALRHQLALLKDMGCDAIRTSHNMPAPELVALCDEMGFMMMLEPFDEWDIAKCDNGYHRYFDEWAEKDMVNMLQHYRNNPSVVMWSVGNEVPTQCSPEGYKVASFLQDICHREDPTRPVTCGMDQVSCVLSNGFAAMIDVPGFNYRTHRYVEAYGKLPQNIVLGSETASTVSSRGVYKFPVALKKQAMYDDHQSTGYDLEACSWSNVPDEDFALADDYNWTIGQFVWTGFDYLGEPSPYDTDAWPSHSSLFGIIDLASLPKDRYYLYRSLWNKSAHTLHVLPHWTWTGREGENTPVFVYTDYPSAELFVNGKSYGKQSKLSAEESRALVGKDSLALQRRYRLMWMDVPYEAGELKVVAYDDSGKQAEEKTVRTAGAPHHLELVADRTELAADGKDLAYVTVRVVDQDGNLCPSDSRMVSFSVKGAGTYRAAANGDATSLDLFHQPQMPAFSGQLTAIVQSGEQSGEIVLEAKAKGVKSAKLVLSVSE